MKKPGRCCGHAGYDRAAEYPELRLLTCRDCGAAWWECGPEVRR